MKLSNQFIEEISSFETIYCLVSGGYHSTASALLLKDYDFKNVILLHNKTFLEMRSSIKTLKLLQEKTNYKYIETKPNFKGETIWDIMKRSFQKIPDAKKIIEKNKDDYDRTIFECCNKLKKYPGKRFYRTLDKKKSVIISSLCPFEYGNRARWLKEIRDKNTFIRFHKKMGNIFYAYPFRDFFSEKPFLPYLRKRGFKEIKHSGCKICPLSILWNKYKSPQYYLSMKAMIRARLPCFQKTIQDFLGG